jgi:exodeoxyribonuclease VII large subunit
VTVTDPESLTAGPRAESVTQFTRRIARELTGLGRVRVEGELAGLKRATSGHVYFDLKDAGARLSCVVWASHVARVGRFQPKEGDRVVASGKLDLYAPRGSYSLVVDRLEPGGVGERLARLEAVKAELRARGWFDRSRPLPSLPRIIGLVTSRDGAALRDFLRTRSLRWPGYPLRLVHTPVQGPGAAAAIAAAIGRLAASGVDLIVVVRGGGSLEDLWAFNEEPVARALFECPVPVVTGIGHETDVTLADLVADHRAHTPTDAAQTVIPDRAQWLQGLERLGQHLLQAMSAALERRAEALERLRSGRALRSADWILGDRGRELGHLWARLWAARPWRGRRRSSPSGRGPSGGSAPRAAWPATANGWRPSVRASEPARGRRSNAAARAWPWGRGGSRPTRPWRCWPAATRSSAAPTAARCATPAS